MAYTPKTWQNGEVIKANDLNHLEQGVASAIASSGGDVDLSAYASKDSPQFIGTMSMNRKNNSTVGKNSVTLGDGGTASGECSCAEGGDCSATGAYSHAEGAVTTASGHYSHAEGYYSVASGRHAHAEGDHTEASDAYTHSGGIETKAIRAAARAEGHGTIANNYASHAMGKYNKEMSAISAGSGVSSTFGDVLVIGNGTSESERSNCFRVSYSGSVYGLSSFNSSGADYAELFEWLDGNQDNEDRAGRFVTLSGDKIRLADPADDFILGIVSGNPSVVGDVHDDQWQGMYLRDIFGRPLWEDVEVPDQLGPVGEVLIPAHMEHRQKLNPNYDSSQPYQARSQRPEWDAVGMMGKLVAVDDGSCQVNGYAAVGEGGIAVASGERTRYRVMARLDDTHVRILIL